MILQIGAFFGNLLSGIGNVAGQVFSAALPSAVGIGRQFLDRELNRKLRDKQRRSVGARAVEALNSPGIAVARIGGTTQPVGGRVQRSTFVPAALTPAQNPFGNIPLLPVGGLFPPQVLVPFPALDPIVRAIGRAVVPFKSPGGSAVANPLARLPGAPGEPRFAKDEFGRTIMFVPSPRPGEGFIRVEQARQLGLAPSKPFWRFNRLQGQFEKIKSRRMNPFNFKATKRAGRRVERTLDAVKELVRIERKMTSGKVTLKKRKRKR